jgi:hypothetical protein
MVRRDDHSLVHAWACPEGEPPVEEGALIAHDPLGTQPYIAGTRVQVDHADLRALKRLNELGRGVARVIPRPMPVAVVHEAIGSFEPERFILDTEHVRQRLAAEGLEPRPLASGPVREPAAGEPRYGSRPRKRNRTSE